MQIKNHHPPTETYFKYSKEEILRVCNNTFGGSISGDTAPPQYSNTGDLKELILSACFTALWSIHKIIFLLVSPLQETVTGSPS